MLILVLNYAKTSLLTNPKINILIVMQPETCGSQLLDTLWVQSPLIWLGNIFLLAVCGDSSLG